ncbi:hypothetical protein L0F63_007259 [Massospora cicadina]|nr:hypothetical protein L0F63_007259 [Massospora cicadina]
MLGPEISDPVDQLEDGVNFEVVASPFKTLLQSFNLRRAYASLPCRLSWFSSRLRTVEAGSGLFTTSSHFLLSNLFGLRVEGIVPPREWCFTEELHYITDCEVELNFYQVSEGGFEGLDGMNFAILTSWRTFTIHKILGFLNELRYNETELYSLMNIYRQIRDDDIDVPSKEQFDTLIEQTRRDEESLKGVEESQNSLKERILDKIQQLEYGKPKAYRLKGLVYTERLTLLQEAQAFRDEAMKWNGILAEKRRQDPQTESHERERLQNEANYQTDLIKDLTKAIDEEEEQLSHVNYSIEEGSLLNAELQATLKEANAQLEAYQQACALGNPHLGELNLWFETGIQVLQNLNQIHQIEAHGFDRLEVRFNLPPTYPCLTLNHSTFATGFVITSAKDPEGADRPLDSDSNNSSGKAYADHEIKEVDLSRLLNQTFSVSLVGPQNLPELIMAVYYELAELYSLASEGGV